MVRSKLVPAATVGLSFHVIFSNMILIQSMNNDYDFKELSYGEDIQGSIVDVNCPRYAGIIDIHLRATNLVGVFSFLPLIWYTRNSPID